MRIVSWNSKVGFSTEKAKYIKSYNADLYVIQECAETNLDELETYFSNRTFYCDYVDSKYGVGLFSEKFNFEILSEHNNSFRYIVPYRIFNKEYEFILFAIWTKNKDKKNREIEYTEQTWKAITNDDYQKYLKGSVIMIGDFNSTNKLKQKPPHSQLIGKLKEYGLESAYHKYHNCMDCDEITPTLFWTMNKDKKYHCDFCFVSSDYRVKNIIIESAEIWEKHKLSDHCPLIIDIE